MSGDKKRLCTGSFKTDVDLERGSLRRRPDEVPPSKLVAMLCESLVAGT